MCRAAVLLSLTVISVSLCSVAQDTVCNQQELAAHGTTVQSVRVEGGGELTSTAEAAAQSELQGSNRRCALDRALDVAAQLVLRVYQEHGYYKAAVEDAITRPAGAGKVDVIFPVTPGVVYKLEDIQFTHVNTFPPQQLRAMFAFRPGDVFNARIFAEGLDGLRKLYVSRGYINFTPIPVPDFNEAAQTVVWTIDLDEGSAFTIGALVLDGPEPVPGVGKRLIADWQPLIGQTYNPELPKRFLQEHAALLRIRNPNPETMFYTLIDDQDHIVTFKLMLPD